jgi:cytochrome oxidase Cu insertion factor (SCO1/SenC/PrrC family)
MPEHIPRIADPKAVAKGRRTLFLIAAVAIAPILASYGVYYLFPREKQVNYGELLAVGPAPRITGTKPDGQTFQLDALRGKWLLLSADPGACDARCTQALYATRQARTIQNRGQERVVRVWLVTDDTAPSAALLAEQPDLVWVRVPATALGTMPFGANRIYLIDPLGNLVLAYPRDPDIKALAKDVTRLLTASRIG